MKELSLAKVEMAAQLADMANERQELRGNLQDARRGEATAREEIDILLNRIKEVWHNKPTKTTSIPHVLPTYLEATLKLLLISRSGGSPMISYVSRFLSPNFYIVFMSPKGFVSNW